MDKFFYFVEYSELYSALEAFGGVVAEDFQFVVCGFAEWKQGGMFVHGFEAQLHARAYWSADVLVVGGEDVVGDAGADVDDEVVLVWSLGVGCCHEGEAVGSDS